MQAEDRLCAVDVLHPVVVLDDRLGHVFDGGELGPLLEVVIGDGVVAGDASACADHRGEGLLIDLSPGDVVLGLLQHSLDGIGLGDDHGVVDSVETQEVHGVGDVPVDVGDTADADDNVCHLHSSCCCSDSA